MISEKWRKRSTSRSTRKFTPLISMWEWPLMPLPWPLADLQLVSASGQEELGHASKLMHYLNGTGERPGFESNCGSRSEVHVGGGPF